MLGVKLYPVRKVLVKPWLRKGNMGNISLALGMVMEKETQEEKEIKVQSEFIYSLSRIPRLKLNAGEF